MVTAAVAVTVFGLEIVATKLREPIRPSSFMPLPTKSATPLLAFIKSVPLMFESGLESVTRCDEYEPTLTTTPEASSRVTTGWVPKTVLLTRVEATSMRSWVGPPVTAVMLWVAGVSGLDAKVSVLAPAVAVSPRLVKVATPALADTVSVPSSVPLLTEAVTATVELVTVLPEKS